ncbi:MULTISPECIES: BtpA/SgcQ family protein [unclassified Chelatococcus]|uniref:BtpA/SgcQ family protein n=1 Tax=unclassified Chelatococcus TaxID=2638111 RepID=UPI001BCFB6EC|nr:MULTISPECIES: BtpA/SgcQ family protein [unclassified Chelatococcus]MBS7701086.1 BtpA/SgcQ family protein [Chelatococcus sp. YT9]MBX3555619.1 BtpA/SgcQ family protein [Chelatococcus sp.]
MKTLVRDEYGLDHLLIGCVHTLALPGTPLYDRSGGMRKIVAQAREEAKILEDAGFSALLYTNESDMPYEANMPIEVITAMTDVIAECQAQTKLPHGVNMLIDPPASIAVAHATGGRFVRAFLTGSLVGDIGTMTPDGARALRLRANLDAENIRIICNVTPGFSINVDTRPVEQQASGAVFIGLADVVCVSGPAAGKEADVSLIERVARQVPDTPVAVGTGVAEENIARLAEVADIFIVGTSIKKDRQTLNAVEPARAQAFVRAYENRKAD